MYHGMESTKVTWKNSEIDEEFFEQTTEQSQISMKQQDSKAKPKELLTSELGEEDERNERKKTLSSSDCKSIKS